VSAAAAAVVAHWARSADLGTIPVLIAAGLAAGALTLTASKLRPELFLGSHGMWATSHAGEFLRGGPRRRGARGAAGEGLAPVGETDLE
jgi:hypothetical protein